MSWQVLENREPRGALEMLLSGFSKTAPDLIANHIKNRDELSKKERERLLLQQENEVAGIEKGLISPELRKEAYKDKLYKEAAKSLGLSGEGTSSAGLAGESTDTGNDQSSPREFSDDQILSAVANPKTREIGKALQEQKKANRSAFEADRAYHTKVSAPIVEKANSIISTSAIKKGLVNQHRRDIASGNTSGFGQFIADKTGMEIWRNPAAARARNAGKQYFLQSLSQLASGAKPNIFLEQQLSSGQTQIGREAEADQTVLDMLEFTDDLEEQKARYELEEAEKDVKKYGYERNDIAQRANKRMTEYADRRQDEMAYTIRKRHEDEIDDSQLTQEMFTGQIPPDTPLTLRAARILMVKNNDNEKKAQAEAKRLGFLIPKESTYNKIK